MTSSDAVLSDDATRTNGKSTSCRYGGSEAPRRLPETRHDSTRIASCVAVITVVLLATAARRQTSAALTAGS